ncbi:MAG: GntG family PLP-dependent aldolase [Flavobacteriales bacterium]|nr:GntG family PLP-dependent aldolase [Flavobacteriales bacterium]
MIVDLRSDTLTKPTAAMREAMANAPVGDDVFGEDPTVNALQEKCAAMFGMEASLFMISGTMGNQAAINVHTQPGHEIICSSLSHIYLYEGAGAARISGCSMRMMEGDRGRISAKDVSSNVNNRNDAHLPYTSMVSLEDTVNKGGGAICNLEEIKRIRKVCDEHHLKLHLDGARMFNALVETGHDYKEYAAPFHSINFCLSKGLGAPVGSILLGSKDFIRSAHRVRKVMGGGMRQAGILAAAGIHALDHHVARLKHDHARAKTIGIELKKYSWVKDVMGIETNIVILQLNNDLKPADLVKKLASLDILCFPFGEDKVRFVTHLDFGDEHLEELIERLKGV